MDKNKSDIAQIQAFANKFPLLTKEEEQSLTEEYYLLRANLLQKIIDSFIVKKRLSICPFLLYSIDRKLLLFDLLAKQFYKKRERELLDELCNRNLRLVLKICQSSIYQNRGLPVFDLFMEGWDGLRYGISHKFNPFLGFKVSTYVTRWIHQRISRSISNKGQMIKISGNIQDIMSKIKVVVREYCGDIANNGEKPSPETIVELLKRRYPKLTNITADRVAALGRLNWDYVSLDELASVSDESNNLTVKDFLTSDEDKYNPELWCESQERQDNIKGLLNLLDNEDEKSIIALKFGLLDKQERTNKQIAKLLKKPLKEINALEISAIERLKTKAKLDMFF